MLCFIGRDLRFLLQRQPMSSVVAGNGGKFIHREGGRESLGVFHTESFESTVSW